MTGPPKSETERNTWPTSSSQTLLNEPTHGPQRLRVSTAAITAALFAVLTVSSVWAVGIGPVSISFGRVYRILAETYARWLGVRSDAGPGERSIVTGIRLPRVLLGGIVGGGLAMSGAVLQALLRNPLADPYIIGVSSGASFGVVTLMLVPGLPFAALSLPAGAFLGALCAFVLVFAMARKDARLVPVRLVLAGVAVAAVLSALTQWIVLTAESSDVRTSLSWTLGSLTGVPLSNVLVPALVTAIVGLIFTAAAGQLNAFALGEEAAGTLGIDVERFRMVLVVLSALLIGTLVAFSGAVGFVALVVPHIVRLLFGTDHRKVLPFSFLVGASFLVWADVAARMVSAPSEVPLGVVTALIGGPFFLWILRRNS